jgi:hypothetical protein
MEWDYNLCRDIGVFTEKERIDIENKIGYI